MAVDLIGRDTIKPGRDGDAPETEFPDVDEGVEKSLGGQILGQGHVPGSIEDVIEDLIEMSIIYVSKGLRIFFAFLDQRLFVLFNHSRP